MWCIIDLIFSIESAVKNKIKLKKIQKIVEYYEHIEKKSLKELADAQNKLEAEKGKHSMLNQYYFEYDEAHKKQINVKGVSVTMLANASFFSGQLHQAIADQVGNVAKKEAECEAKKQAWQKAYIARNKVQKILEKEQAKLAILEDRLEQKKLDELVNVISNFNNQH